MTTMPIKTTMHRWLAALATMLVAALLLQACGGGGEDRTKAQVRLVNASGSAATGYTSLDLRVHDELRQGAVVYGGSESYAEVDPSKADTTVTSSSSPTALLSFTPTVSARKHYSVLAYGARGALKQLLLDEDTGAPDTNRTLLRIVNAAPDAGALDVYVTAASDTLPNSVPVQSAAAYGTLGSYITLISGTWQISVTAAGSKTDVRLTLPSVALASKQIATLVLTPSAGGVLVNALLINQQSGIGKLDTTLARVRVAAGVSDGATVVARIGGDPPVLSGNSPAVSSYAARASGSAPVVSVTVNSTAVTVPAQELKPGADYTLVVYGLASAPQAAWVPDDNRLPSNSALARLRLVNGVAGGLQLSMNVNLEPVLSAGVDPGKASDYAEVTPSTTARVTVTTGGQTVPVYTAVDQIFTAGATYTVFVLGARDATGAAVGTVRKDR